MYTAVLFDYIRAVGFVFLTGRDLVDRISLGFTVSLPGIGA